MVHPDGSKTLNFIIEAQGNKINTSKYVSKQGLFYFDVKKNFQFYAIGHQPE